ncbi:MAG TPA: hypothetical protein VMT63_10230 [Bacteroidales bacterium]|nr:hypothetical protein [Bacteroidales bacterium]
MKFAAALLLALIPLIVCSAQPADSASGKIKITASLSINSNGMNPIPAFALGKPAATASISAVAGRFSYDPGLAYGLDAKPWYIDNWFHFIIINRTHFKLRTGINFSMFFSEKSITNEKFLEGVRYWTGDLEGIFIFNPSTSVVLSYWSDNGQEHGTLTGHFVSLTGEKNSIGLGKSVKMTASVQVFMISYDGPNDGVFVSPKVSFFYRKCPLSVYSQFNQPVKTDIVPYPGFQWNIGAAYTF